jgi:hypothetical protein
MYYQVENAHSNTGPYFEEPQKLECTLDGMPVIQASYANKLNSQVTWSAKLNGIVDPGTGINPRIVTLRCGDWTSMPLVVLSASVEAMPPTTTFTGTDIFSWQMSATYQTMPTFLNSTGVEILQAMAAKVGVNISGGPTYPIEQFEIQVGGSMNEYLGRICKDFAYNYLITPNGVQLFQGNTGDSTTINGVVSLSRTRNLKDLKSIIVLKKKSRYTTRYEFSWNTTGVFTGSFSTPLDLNSIRYIEEAVSGHVGYIAYFTGNLLSGGAVLDELNTPPFSTWGGVHGTNEITSVTFDVVPNPPPFDTVPASGKLVVYGRPYNLNPMYDITFETSYIAPPVAAYLAQTGQQVVLPDGSTITESSNGSSIITIPFGSQPVPGTGLAPTPTADMVMRLPDGSLLAIENSGRQVNLYPAGTQVPGGVNVLTYTGATVVTISGGGTFPVFRTVFYNSGSHVTLISNPLPASLSGRVHVVESTLWANLAVGQAILPYMFQDINRSCDGYSVKCVIDQGLLPGGMATAQTEYMTATGRIEGVSWSYGGGAPSTTIELSNINALASD